MKKYADRKRTEQDIKVGDLVLLDRAHLSIDAYNMVRKQKFLPKWIGPFLVLKKINCKVLLRVTAKTRQVPPSPQSGVKAGNIVR
jgi:hypothetical protein